MKNYLIGGIQQMGIGVSNFTEAWKWYNNKFGMDCRIFEEEAEAKLMLPYTAGVPRKRHAALVINLQSGGGFEVWQHTGKVPEKISEEIRLGDLGILACKMKVKSISSAFAFFRENGTEVLGEPEADPDGKMTFFIKDPFGNIFQMVESNYWFMNENKPTGGNYGALIGVSDIDRARSVYTDIIGYDEVVYDKTGIFKDFADIPAGNGTFRRVLLRSSKPVAGPFSRIFGRSEIELIASTGKAGKKTFEGRLWGDPGFIHLCFDINGMDKLREYCRNAGYPFTVDSEKSSEGNSFDMGEAAGHFAYIADPDGILIEFVETHKIPILRKAGWYMNIKNRDPYKPLPDWILRTLRFSRVKM